MSEPKTLFVVAPFAAAEGVKPSDIPQNKSELIALLGRESTNKTLTMKQGWGYTPMESDVWINSESVYDLNVSKDFPFEPYYVTHRNTLFYDETYVTWGYDKVTHSYDMRHIDYKLKALPEAFIVHLNHNDLKGYKGWMDGFDYDGRYNLRVGTSEMRRKKLPGLLVNTYQPEHTWNLTTVVNSSTKCKSSKTTDKLTILRNTIATERKSAKSLKQLLYILLAFFAVMCFVLALEVLKTRN